MVLIHPSLLMEVTATAYMHTHVYLSTNAHLVKVVPRCLLVIFTPASSLVTFSNLTYHKLSCLAQKATYVG